MKKWTFHPVEVELALTNLLSSGRKLFCDELPKDTVLKRHQMKLYPSAINFTAPVNSVDCGRYNPPGGAIPVWYASDSSLTAMAESYGRLLHLQGTISFPESILGKHYICSIGLVRPVEVIDVVRLSEMLHIPLDSLENEDYTFTQWLMEHLHTLFRNEYDGIAYSSRHRRYKRCYAFWQKPGGENPFRDTPDGMVSIEKYKEYDPEIVPKDWPNIFISGDEMLEELLNFAITAEPT